MQSGVSFYLVGVLSLLAQKVLGFTYGTPFTIALDVNEIGEVGGLVSSYLLWVIHCFIVGLKISIIFIISVLRHSLFQCFIVAYSNALKGSPQGQSHSSHHPQLWFCLGQFSFFNLPGLFLSCFECCILEPDSEEGSASVRFDFATPALFPPYPLARALLVPFPFHTQGKGTYVRSP